MNLSYKLDSIYLAYKDHDFQLLYPGTRVHIPKMINTIIEVSGNEYIGRNPSLTPGYLEIPDYNLMVYIVNGYMRYTAILNKVIDNPILINGS